MSRPTTRQRAQRLFELTTYREQLRETLNDQRRHLAAVDREIRRIVQERK